MKVIAVIPARLASTRLPRKMLREIAGEPLLAWVYRGVRRCSLVDQVIVATDSDEILRFCQQQGFVARMTSAAHRSGTERAHEISTVIAGDVYLNVQGDEPLLDPAGIDAAIDALDVDTAIGVSTLAVPITIAADIMDPNVVKTVLDFEDRALYFSRAPIPWVRDDDGLVHARHLKHLGLYAFRRDALLEFPTLPMGVLERVEQLEQLRWLENGYPIRVVETLNDSVSVDVPEDVERVEKLLRATGED